MRPALLSVVILVVLGHAAKGTPQQQEALSAATCEFGQELHQKIARDKDTFVFSPLSSHSIVSLAYLGARNETAWEMNKTLSLESLPDDEAHDAYEELLTRLKSIQDVKVNVVNGLFVAPNKNIEENYKRDGERKYSAEVEQFNKTDSERGINEWMADETDDLVTEILPRGSIDDKTVMILVNAICVNGTWQDRFDKNFTRKEDFTRPDGSKIQVDMMNDNRTVLLKRDEENRVDIAELPLRGGQLALFIVLPRETQGTSRLEDLIKDQRNVDKLLENTKPTYCNVCIPKFKISSKVELQNPLKEMGMVKATSRDEADFSGISKDEDIHIDKVVHQTVIEVDEDGTLAAAGSGLSAEASAKSSEEPKDIFYADHSFMFFVQEKESKQILLQGKYSGERI